MNKLRYEKPFAEIVEFDTRDLVVAASGDGGSTNKDCMFRDPGTGSWCLIGSFLGRDDWCPGTTGIASV